MQDETHGVVGGAGLLLDGTWWTADGLNFNGSIGEIGVLTTQAMYSLGKGHYAFVGEGDGEGTLGGVGYSSLGGRIFAPHPIPNASVNLPPGADARYGAFPSPKTWYVTAGNWPSSSVDKSPLNRKKYKYVSQRLRINLAEGRFERLGASAPAPSPSSDADYNAAILKSSDGGKTWTKQFQDSGNFYFNQVDCASETVCMAVAEGFEKDGSGSPGAHIFKTTDGETWKEIYVFGADTGGSVLAVSMLSETEAWVATTFSKSLLNNGAAMLHTTDGGKTWVASKTLADVGDVTALTFINETCAYASAVTIAQDSTVLAYGVSKPPPGPPPVPGGYFVQEQCSDDKCKRGCREGKFAQNSCLQTTSGGSALVNCSSDGSKLNTIEYDSPDCSGNGTSHVEPTAVCLNATSGGFFENICPNATSVRAAVQQLNLHLML